MAVAKPRTLRSRVTPIRPVMAMAEGQAALVKGDWRAARRAYQRALAEGEQPEALEGLGLAAWWLDQPALVFSCRERAHRLYRHRGDRASAARMAVWLAWDSAAFRGEVHVANGWLHRARHLLDGLAPCPEHAWWAVRAGVFALLGDGDPSRALALADEAVRIARRTRAVDYEIIAAALAGFARVTMGDVARGMRQLDDVNGAVIAGEARDPIAIGLAGCYLIAACERVRDSERAMEWCTRLTAFCRSWGLKPLLAVCRTQYASVCLWRGDWVAAEKELVRATDDLVASRPAMSGEGQARLGELRRRQGRLAEAEQLFARAGHHPLASLGLAAVALDRGDADTAVDLLERQLRRAPRSNRTERAMTLDLLVRARLASGAIEQARASARALAIEARAIKTPSIAAAASVATGLVAARSGDTAAAVASLEDAIDLYERCGAPFEAAQTRLELASVLAETGDRTRAPREAQRAVEAFAGLHADGERQRAERVLARAAVNGTPRDLAKTAAGLSSRERDVVRLIAKGLSNPRIAGRLFISEHTVHRHVANIFNKLTVRSRSAVAARAAALGLLEP